MSAVRVLQFTDCHLMSDPEAVLRGIRTLPALQACIDSARERHLPADAIAVTGDLVQDDPGGYGLLELLLEPLGTPVLLIPGNHDLPVELGQRLSHPPFQVGSEWTAGDWVVVMLGTWFPESKNGEGRLGEVQLEHLEATLAQHRDRHALVCLHHQPLPMESRGIDELGLMDREGFVRVIDRHPNVKGVAWGHAHQSLDVLSRGIRWMCTPATCMQFKPRQPGFEVDDRPPGYRVIDLLPDGGIVTEVVWLEGYRK